MKISMAGCLFSRNIVLNVLHVFYYTLIPPLMYYTNVLRMNVLHVFYYTLIPPLMYYTNVLRMNVLHVFFIDH